MRSPFILSLCLPLSLVIAGCPDDDPPDPNNNTTPDAGFPDSGVEEDAGFPDAGFPDAGFPCRVDQGGEANRGCDPGEVCNLTMDPPTCVPGEACTTDMTCNKCSDLANPEDCGHGFPLTAFCDDRHGNVCTRSRASCEPCETDRDCGRLHPDLSSSEDPKCVEYASGDRYCARPAPCPDGFQPDVDGFCVRSAGCSDEPVLCPADPNPGVNCAGTGQICPREECPDTGGALCSTNDIPGALGICIGFCTQNSDCPSNLPFCDQANGLCGQGCTPGSCPNGFACHLDGECNPPCDDNEFCESNYGDGTYCNQAAQPPPRIFKAHRDTNSCAPLGCELAEDCPPPGEICDRTLTIPECVPGCFQKGDCTPGDVCKSGPQRQFDREQCRALNDVADGNDTEIGVCCDPGCLDRVQECNIGEFCCGEPGSAYETADSCLTLTSTGTRQAEPGQCFEHGGPAPWCNPCPIDMSTGLPMACPVTDWTSGFNVDPEGMINGGQPFNEQEYCVGIAQGVAICGVTCNPNEDDNGCPGRWPCQPNYPRCLQDSDCEGLPCIGVLPPAMPGQDPTPGYCQCASDVPCPNNFALINQIPGQPPADNPRCIEQSVTIVDENNNLSTLQTMVCIASYQCEPPGFNPDDPNYPAACGL